MDASTPAGVWQLRANGYRAEMVIRASGGGYAGSYALENGAAEPLTDIRWDAAGRWLEFSRKTVGFTQWYRLRLVYGVAAGRFSHEAPGSARPALTAFVWHVTGWSPTWLDTDIAPRSWDIVHNGRYQAVLRIDRDIAGALCGRLKFYDDSSTPGDQEWLEDDLTNISWDGVNLAFTRPWAGGAQVYRGVARGRFISGSSSLNGGPAEPWSGARSQVLGFGLGSRHGRRSAWQEAFRAQILNLTEGMGTGDAARPVAATVEAYGLDPLGGRAASEGLWPERDDDPKAFPPSYTLRRLRFSVSPGSAFDPANPPPAHVFRAYLAAPAAPPPPGGYPAVLALTGHGGGMESPMLPNGMYWYGDAMARRGYVVLSLDTGHRSDWGYPGAQYPAIVDSGYRDSNWEQYGERVFEARRAIDWLLAQPNIRADRLFAVGLSMGGAMATFTAALDPRVAMTLCSGFSPDLHVLDALPACRCYRWNNADISEYVDMSDFQAMIAPRPLVIETGRSDAIFSGLPTPWAGDKQVTRRARAAYGPEAGRLVHYLHYDAHAFHMGGANPAYPGRPRGVTALSVIAPAGAGDQGWQTDSATRVRADTLFDLMDELDEKRVFLTSGSSWTVPPDWNSARNSIECLGGGGGGCGGGGGGGGYSAIRNLALTPGAVVSYGVGAGGAGAVWPGAGGHGGNAWFNGASLAAASVGAEGGRGSSAADGGAGGRAAAGVGAVRRSGGAGASGALGAGGGGGCAGPDGDGANGGAGGPDGGGGGGGGANGGAPGAGAAGVVGGAGGAGHAGFGGGPGGGGGGGWGDKASAAGSGGNGSSELVFDASHGCGSGGGGAGAGTTTVNGGAGGLHGAGGGGYSGAGVGAAGAPGLIVIRYRPRQNRG